MLEPLLNTRNKEEILLYLFANKEGYAREISRFYGKSLCPIQNQLDKLEYGNVLVSKLSGKTRIYFFNKRYPFLKELYILLEKAMSFLPDEERRKLLLVRKRPRRKGKPF